MLLTRVCIADPLEAMETAQPTPVVGWLQLEGNVVLVVPGQVGVEVRSLLRSCRPWS